MMDPATDELSDLPINILHEILSRLPRKYAAMTCMLSKAWREAWYTFPIISISDNRLFKAFRGKESSFIRQRDKFNEYVKKTLLRFNDRGLAIKEFKLRMNLCDHGYMSRQEVDLWVKLACKNGVQVLELFLSVHGPPWYTLPPQVLETKSLNKLVLTGIIKVDQSFLNCSTQIFTLRELSLWHLHLGDENSIEHLISHCPMIEQITLNFCYIYPVREGLPPPYLKSLSMNGFQKLKAVDAIGIQELHIDAPNLESLSYSPRYSCHPFKLNFISCRNLRQLKLWCLKNTSAVEDKWFFDLCSKFSFLEILKLFSCFLPERIDISYAQLKVLELHSCSNLKEINIDAPKLVSCRYVCKDADKPVISFLSSSIHLEVTVMIQSYWATRSNWREFIQNFKPPNVLASSLSLIIDPCVIQPVRVSSSPPPRIKHLVLPTLLTDKDVVELLLSICFPETISLSFKFVFHTRPFLVDFYNALLAKWCWYCRFRETKCWWHGLNVKVTCSWMIQDDDENPNFESMLDAFPVHSTRQQQNINFSLEL